MKKLNFHPYYERLLRDRRKWVTIRLGDQRNKYPQGEIMNLTVGWSENEIDDNLGNVKIVEAKYKKIEEIVDMDLIGESPDCTHKDAIEYVLSSIYRQVVSKKDHVTIIKWEYI